MNERNPFESPEQGTEQRPPRRRRPVIDFEASKYPLPTTGVTLWILAAILRTYHDNLVDYLDQRLLWGITGTLSFVGSTIILFCIARFVLRKMNITR